MAIETIRVSNFKGFAHFEMNLGRFNVLVGANASGKTSIVQIFKFLRDTALFGLDNAISLQGGSKYLRNMRLPLSEPFRIELVTKQRISFRLRPGPGRAYVVRAASTKISHTLALMFKTRGNNFEILEDRLRIKAHFNILGSEAKKGIDIGEGELLVENVRGRPRLTTTLPENKYISSSDLLLPYFFEEYKLEGKQTVSLGLPLYYIFATSGLSIGDIFGNIGVYDFDPKLPKKAVQITGKAELGEDGNNLALILKSVIEDKDSKRKLSALVRDLLPLVQDLSVDSFSDKSLLFKMREKHLKKEYLPASLISDGTISAAALIVALYFERKSIVVLEEPERNIHPYLMNKLVNMMLDASRHKQVIVTTHNPGIVKFAGVDNLMMLARDEDGFCTVKRAADSMEVQAFLKNEIGIEEIYSQNLL